MTDRFLTPEQKLAAEALGERFLAYVTASDEAAVRARVAGVEIPGFADRVFAEVLAGAAWLIDNRRTMMVNDREQPVPVREALAGFANYVPDHSMSFANFLRVKAGGTVPRPRTRDPLIRALQVMGSDWFPATLLPAPEESLLFGMPWQHVGLSSLSYRHPSGEEFRRLLSEEEEPLRALFPEGNVEETTASRFFWATTGHGGSIQPVLLPQLLLSTAEIRLRVTGLEPTHDALLQAVAELVREMRRLAHGKSVEIPAVVGLAPVRYERSEPTVTPWGTLAPVNDTHRQLGMEPGGAVLQTTFRLALHFRSPDAGADPESGLLPDPPPDDLRKAHEDLAQRVDRVRLLLLLALEQEQPVGVVSTGQYLSDPTTLAGSSRRLGPPVPGVGTISDGDGALSG